MARQHHIYGIHAVLAAIRHDTSNVVMLYFGGPRKDQRIQEIRSLATRSHVPITDVSRDELAALAGEGRHQGVVAQLKQIREFNEDSLEPLLEALHEPPFLLILDGIQDPHNLGACLRCADGAGIHAVIAPKDKAVGMTAVVSKTASGAAESIPFIQVTNLVRSLEMLKARGIWITGMDGCAEQSVYDLDLSGPCAIVLGAEGRGLRRLTREHCDYLAKIPMAGQVESLNVSVAAGVCLFEAVRQRNNV